jgi:predicted nuclease of restriction endonuclease-like (RecB) superfamily
MTDKILEIENNEYREFLTDLKTKIKTSQLSAMRAVNKELISLYWDIGKNIAIKQQESGWGKSVVEKLAKDLQIEFAGMKGFSERNLWRMRSFYMTYKDNLKLPQLVAEIGWSHNILILEKCKDNLEREYYIKMARKFGWSRNVLVHNIEASSFSKFVLNQTSFDQTLSEKLKSQAKLAVKDDYNFSFLGLEEDHYESDLEHGLVYNIRKFLDELGGYFTFVGSQYRVEVDEKEFFIDLLLYHRSLNALVAIELKRGEFKPEYAGKMAFYLTALDKKVKLEHENPSIGLIICRSKSRTLVEYTLQDSNKPMGVATYTAFAKLPKEIAAQLPSPEDIEKHLEIFIAEETSDDR